jgi:hypothetical protein
MHPCPIVVLQLCQHYGGAILSAAKSEVVWLNWDANQQKSMKEIVQNSGGPVQKQLPQIKSKSR